jgi:septum formation protein
MQNIILASSSPRRKQLLEWAEVPFEVVVKSIEETFPDTLNIEDVPVYIAREKALEVKRYLNDGAFHQQHANKPILAADTVVVLDSRIIGKPANRLEALEILQSLSGNTHRVITGVVIQHNDEEVAFSDVTSVEFHELTKEQIEFYVDKYEPYDKAGAYAIQEWIGVVGIKSVQGDFYNVMGLPVSKVIKELKKLELAGQF